MALNFQQNEATSVRRIVFGALLAGSLVLTTVYCREGDGGPLHAIQGAFGVVASPMRNVGAHVGSAIESTGDSVADATADDATLAELREQNRQLRSLLAQADEYRIEVERLQGLLDIKSKSGVSGVTATVVGKSLDAWNQTVTIDKGTADGLQSGMTVMGSSGVVGQVSRVEKHSAMVRLLTDPNSGAAVMVQSSRANGIVRGSLEGLLYLEDIPEDSIPVVGDVVITSGLGGSYTSGLIVGTVVSVEKTTANATGRIVVSMNDDVSQLENVIVVTAADDSGSSANTSSSASGSSASSSVQ